MKLRSLLPFVAFAGAAFAGDFTTEAVAGRRLSLIHDTKIETYSLGKNGVVLAQFGQKDGPITGPAFRWVVEDGHLLITDGKATQQKFELIEQSEKSLKVRRRNGDTSVFAITHLSE